jgi:hypothetical protein
VTPGWVAAAVLGAALVGVLTVVTLRLLRSASALADDLKDVRGRVVRLEKELRAGGGGGPVRASSLLVLLEPRVLEHRQLAADIRAHQGLPVGLPTRLRVTDSDAGRALVGDFPLPVEFEQRTRPMEPDAPAVLVLDRSGQVMGGGVAASVSEVRDLVGRAGR